MAMEYDPLLLIALRREIVAGYGGVRVTGVWLEPEGRRAGIEFEGRPALHLLLHPTRGHVLADAGLRRPAAADRESFRNVALSEARVPPDERLLELDLGTPGYDPRWRVVLELLTNQWNLLLLGLPEGEIQRVLWPRSPGDRVLRTGGEYRPPAGGRAGSQGGVSRERWRDLLAAVAVEERRSTALRSIAYLSGINVDWVLGAAAESDAPGELEAAHGRYRELLRVVGGGGAGSPDTGADSGTSLAESGRGAWLLPTGDAFQPYVHPLGRDDAREFPSLLEAMDEAARVEGVVDELGTETPARTDRHAAPPPDPELLDLVSALRDRHEELDRRREALARELEDAGDPEELRAVGHLLLARKGRIPRGEDRVELEDFDGSPRTVELDPALDTTENARRYYREASRRERARRRIPEEIGKTEDEATRVETALDRAESCLSAGESPSEERMERWWALAGGPPDGGDQRADGDERLPYRVLRTSGDLEVRVGRSARDNEELTFHHSAPDDIWLHARQVPGSHVILRWGHRDGNPPRRDLQEAAVAAAVNSKARHSGTVGVDWTRRKYVRSPRKSAPGVVVPERVQTLFVRPNEAVVKLMTARAARRGG